MNERGRIDRLSLYSMDYLFIYAIVAVPLIFRSIDAIVDEIW